MANKINNEIKITPYNPEWPEFFKIEKVILRKILEDKLLDIHHIGSTSIIGLVAKPVIDIIVITKQPDINGCLHQNNNNDIRSKLEKIGYNYRGEYNIPFRDFYSKKENSKYI